MKDDKVNPTPKNAAAELDEQPADLIAQISQCLAGRVTVPLDNVTSQTSFAELGVDSLSFLELIVDVEKTFDVSFCPAICVISRLTVLECNPQDHRSSEDPWRHLDKN